MNSITCFQSKYTDFEFLFQKYKIQIKKNLFGLLLPPYIIATKILKTFYKRSLKC